MSNEVTTTQEQGSLPALQSMFHAAMQAASNKDIDADKMKLLVELATTQQDREAERRFRIAKQRALLAMPMISKRGAILNKQGAVQSRYSKFEDIHRIVKPILAGHNLTISFNVSHVGQTITVQPILAYADDEVAFEERGGEMPLSIDTTGSKNATQGAGSAASYGKRHAMKAMLNIIEGNEDDDGQAAGGSLELPADKVTLIDASRSAAMDGTEAYRAFFAALDRDSQGFLNYSVDASGKPYHEQNKEAATLYD